MRVDPIRLIEAVVAAVAAIGISAGLHTCVLAFGATVLTLIVLLVLSRFERRMSASTSTRPDQFSAGSDHFGT